MTGPQKGSTVADLAKMSGVTPRTIERWWKEGVIPDCTFRNEKGWKVWGPEATRRVLDIAIARRKIPVTEQEEE